MNTQDWFLLGLTGLIALQSKGSPNILLLVWYICYNWWTSVDSLGFLGLYLIYFSIPGSCIGQDITFSHHFSLSLSVTVFQICLVFVDLGSFEKYSTWSGLPWWFSGNEPAFQCRRHEFDPWVGKICWRRKWQPTVVFLPGKTNGQRSLAGYSP